MKNNRRNVSTVGVIVLEFFACAGFLALFLNAKTYRDSQQNEDSEANEVSVQPAAYQMYETSPLAELLVDNSDKPVRPLGGNSGPSLVWKYAVDE